jgi:ubiquinone/menaquinone biosynthesis C-methylase UbiE
MKQWKIAVMRNAGRNVVSANRGLTRLFYNAMGRFYDLLYHRFIRGYVESAGTLMENLVDEGDTVLDVGCGTGLLSYLAAPRASRVVGVDLSMGMLQKGLKKKGAGHVHFINADALQLPLKGSFDCCVSAFMLVMLPKPKRWIVIEEMTRLLKPGGRIAFLTSRSELGDQWFTPQEWREGLEKLGIANLRIEEKGDVFLNVVGFKPSLAGQDEVRNFSRAYAPESVEHTYIPDSVPVWTT